MELDEAQRLQALADYRVLDTPIEDTFDNIARITAKIFHTPISLITLVDERRQWFKARVGLDLQETAREHAFCDQAIRGEGPLVVPDATQDPRFVENPLVIGDPRIRFYCGVPLRTPEGHALGTLCLLDRVPRTMAEDELDALRALARQVEVELEIRRRLVLLEEALAHERRQRRDKELLASMIVHDLRNPLGSVLLAARLVQGADEVSRELLLDILGEAERMGRMLTDVLDVCLRSFGALRPRRVERDVEPIVLAVQRRLTRLAAPKGQTLVVEPPSAPVRLLADPSLLERVLENLVANAIQHGPRGEPISIGYRVAGTGVRFEVRDRGAAIAEESRLTIFDPLEQLDARTSRGYGLGLAFCRLAVEAHGGTIAVGPAEGGGNCFAFEIPR